MTHIDATEPRPTPLITPSNMWEAPHIRWAQSHTRELLPSARVSRGDMTTVLPRRPRDLAALRFDHAGREWTLAAAMEQTGVEGCMVIHDGAIVFEHYAGGMTAATRHLCQSVSKSMTSALAGALAAAGRFGAETLVTDYVDELTGTVWEGCTAQHLLDMTAGVSFDENDYDDMDSEAWRGFRALGWLERLPHDPPGRVRRGAAPAGRARRRVRVPLDLHRRPRLVSGPRDRPADGRALLRVHLEAARRRARRRLHRRAGRVPPRRRGLLRHAARPRPVRPALPAGGRDRRSPGATTRVGAAAEDDATRDWWRPTRGPTRTKPMATGSTTTAGGSRTPRPASTGAMASTGRPCLSTIRRTASWPRSRRGHGLGTTRSTTVGQCGYRSVRGARQPASLRRSRCGAVRASEAKREVQRLRPSPSGSRRPAARPGRRYESGTRWYRCSQVRRCS